MTPVAEVVAIIGDTARETYSFVGRTNPAVADNPIKKIDPKVILIPIFSTIV